MRVPIIAYERRHAEYAAYHVLRLRPSEYNVIQDDLNNQLRGLLRGTTVILIVDPRHKPSERQRQQREAILQICKVREFQIRELFLP